MEIMKGLPLFLMFQDQIANTHRLQGLQFPNESQNGLTTVGLSVVSMDLLLGDHRTKTPLGTHQKQWVESGKELGETVSRYSVSEERI